MSTARRERLPLLSSGRMRCLSRAHLNFFFHAQRDGRDYDYAAVVEWFASRADMIILMFDAHKLDISDELRSVIDKLKPHQVPRYIWMCVCVCVCVCVCLSVCTCV